jgi:hypothetical protein
LTLIFAKAKRVSFGKASVDTIYFFWILLDKKQRDIHQRLGILDAVSYGDISENDVFQKILQYFRILVAEIFRKST